MARFKTKPTFVRATQWFKSGDHDKVIRCLTDGCNILRDVVMICGVKVSVFPGDWIVEDESGEMLGPCSQEMFDRLYEPAE